MKFNVELDVSDLPQTRYSSSPGFDKLTKDKGDLLLVCEPFNARVICFRDGRSFTGLSSEKGVGDICTLIFDDFVPGMNLDDNPDWHEPLKGRIMSVYAEQNYGPEQGIIVTENVELGCAVAKIRNQQASWGRNGELVNLVKISAKGSQSLDDARELHQKIISGTS